MKQEVLNFGCNEFKLHGFTNIDIDSSNNPDVLMNIMNIDSVYSDNTVDFIYAGHFFEHISYEDGIELMIKVQRVLKKYSSIVITIPDYIKTTKMMSVSDSERIILNHGNHVSLYTASRLEDLAKKSGFRFFAEVGLTQVPWMILPAGENPVPEEWQTSYMFMKT